MPRNYKKLTDRGTIPPEVLEQAVKSHLGGMSFKNVAEMYLIPVRTLARYCAKAKVANSTNIHYGYKKPRQVFSEEQEKLLTDYIKKASDIYYGLSPKEVRKFGYEFAKANNIKMPDRWIENEMAGVDWFSCYLKRNKDLSIRTPEATSQARASSFNPTNVARFFQNLQEVLNRGDYLPTDIYNMDETGVTTVQKPNRVVSRRGYKQIGRITSAERGQLVTMALAVSAAGNMLPPFFVFPRKYYKEHFIRDGPPGSHGDANPSGWMVQSNFINFAQHFIRHSRCSKERPVILLLDNHDSHLSINALDLLKDNGVTVLSFPPHCSHKLQPLDRSVYGPFKKFFNTASDSWITNHPGCTMTIYDIPGIVKVALPQAATPRNIVSGFEVSGISPFNRNIFKEEEFLPNYTTDRPAPLTTLPSTSVEVEEEEEVPGPSNTPDYSETIQVETQPSTSQLSYTPSRSQTPNLRIITPEELRPFTKAGPRKTTRKGRKQRKTEILTDTPVKNELKSEMEKRQTKKKLKKNSKETRPKAPAGLKKPKHVRKDLFSDTDSEEEYFCLICMGPYGNSKPGEEWLQCSNCKNWSHSECVGGATGAYECHNCKSDDDDFI